MTIIRDIMSIGAMTVEADTPLRDVIGKLRRIGHEGYPVVRNGEIVGLLAARDMNRADANALAHLTVGAVMMAGNVQVTPELSVRRLPALMLETGWGQIPVVEGGSITGIITRTDVIRFYAEAESGLGDGRKISHEQVANVLGQSAASIIAFVAQQAAEQRQTVYMVGGVVRDLLLQRPNLDIDFVLEGDAIAFAKAIGAAYGGRVETHVAFGTAKWIFDDKAAANIGHNRDDLPPYIDLVTARHEFYEQPAVLPTVYTGGIKLDLRRRDFTVNALAVRLGADGAGGTVIDLFGGLVDLEKQVIRVLHSLSFADDPTRVLRAVRFSHRLGFAIDPRTADLIDTALPMLGRVTGERLRNELTLLFTEPDPATALLRLQTMGVLRAIHDTFVVTARVRDVLVAQPGGDTFFSWLLVATCMQPEAVAAMCERLMFGKNATEQLVATAKLVHTPGAYLAGTPSDVTVRLDMLPEQSIQAAMTALAPAHRTTAERYLSVWRHVKTRVNGVDLKRMGLTPGPRFKAILNTLRAARLDGMIQSDVDEREYLAQLIRESEQ
jgi:tRNA nucleotidyltransferase (CCA-adding enzyme)